MFSFIKRTIKKKGYDFDKNVFSKVVNTAKDVSKGNIRQGVISANRLNIRSLPNKTGKVLGQLTKGNVIAVLDQTSDGWCHFKYNNQSAYTFGKYVSFFKGKIIANALNVRKDPSLNAEIIGKVHKGDDLEVFYRYPKWIQVSVNGKTGFVYAKYIQLRLEANTGGNTSGGGGGKVTPPAGKFLKDSKVLLSSQLEANHKLKIPSKPRSSRVTAEIYNNYGALLKKLSEEIGIDMATAIAVMAVESGGKGFGKTGKPLIRFENHLFYSYWGRRNPKTFARHFKYNTYKRWTGHLFRKSTSSKWEAFHGNQAKEWEVLEFARTLNNFAAYKSASYGLPQVIGSNFHMLGYRNAEEMVEHFSKDIRYHILGLFDFFDDAMISHLKRKRFTSFAKLYNGSGQATRYGQYINIHYRAFKRL